MSFLGLIIFGPIALLMALIILGFFLLIVGRLLYLAAISRGVPPPVALFLSLAMSLEGAFLLLLYTAIPLLYLIATGSSKFPWKSRAKKFILTNGSLCALFYALSMAAPTYSYAFLALYAMTFLTTKWLEAFSVVRALSLIKLPKRPRLPLKQLGSIRPRTALSYRVRCTASQTPLLASFWSEGTSITAVLGVGAFDLLDKFFVLFSNASLKPRNSSVPFEAYVTIVPSNPSSRKELEGFLDALSDARYGLEPLNDPLCPRLTKEPFEEERAALETAKFLSPVEYPSEGKIRLGWVLDDAGRRKRPFLIGVPKVIAVSGPPLWRKSVLTLLLRKLSLMGYHCLLVDAEGMYADCFPVKLSVPEDFSLAFVDERSDDPYLDELASSMAYFFSLDHVMRSALYRALKNARDLLEESGVEFSFGMVAENLNDPKGLLTPTLLTCSECLSSNVILSGRELSLPKLLLVDLSRIPLDAKLAFLSALIVQLPKDGKVVLAIDDASRFFRGGKACKNSLIRTLSTVHLVVSYPENGFVDLRPSLTIEYAEEREAIVRPEGLKVSLDVPSAEAKMPWWETAFGDKCEDAKKLVEAVRRNGSCPKPMVERSFGPELVNLMVALGILKERFSGKTKVVEVGRNEAP